MKKINMTRKFKDKFNHKPSTKVNVDRKTISNKLKNTYESLKVKELRKSTKENPLSQEELYKFIESNPDNTFEIEQISIPVKIKKAKGGEVIKTSVLSRSGKVIEETTNIAKEGFAIDIRKCINGQIDTYTKKPEKVQSDNYTFDDNRTFTDLSLGETTQAHTVAGEVRKAIVAKNDTYIQTAWGEVQYIAKGGIISFVGKEGIGNNNPCDWVIKSGNKKGNIPLTNLASEVKKDYLQNVNKDINKGLKDFFDVASSQDKINPLLIKLQKEKTR